MDREPLELIHPNWKVPDRVRALCTTRIGGVSINPYDEFNLATHVGDDFQSVQSNRDLLQKQLNLPTKPCWLNQTHSTNVTDLSHNKLYNQDSDAAISKESGKIAVVMTADCLPILLCNREGTEVAAIHAGWRGLVDGIIENTLHKMDSDTSQLLAWIGPAISQNRFEVGQEVFDLFVDYDHRAVNRFDNNRPGHWFCDLPGLAEDRLRLQGVSDIYQSGLCSFNDASRFFSYRRNKVTGRMACMIWIN